MGAQGTTTLDFGAFPGTGEAATIVFDAAVVAGSLCEAWLRPETTADHTEDDHIIENLKVYAAGILPGLGFVIRGFSAGSMIEPVWDPKGNYSGGKPDAQNYNRGGKSPLLYGVWSINWVWN